MANERSQNTYRGILISDPRITKDAIWSAHSSYTQATPRSGVPEAQDVTDLVLESSGEQAASKELRIQTIRAGHPVREGGQFAWRYNGDALWRGWDFPTVAVDWETLVWANNTGATKQGETPDAITLSTGEVLVAHQRKVNDGADKHAVYLSVRNPTTGAWTSSEIVKLGSVTTYGTRPCLLELPSGRVLMFHFVARSGQMQVTVRYSDNSGATWAIAQENALITPIDTGTYDPNTMRVAYKDGQILLVVALEVQLTATNRHIITQYASDDLGASFQQVEIGTYPGNYPSLESAHGSFWLLFLDANLTASYRKISSAYTPLSSATETTIAATAWANGASNNRIVDGDLASFVTDDGVIFVLGRAYGGTKPAVMAWSADQGATWTQSVDISDGVRSWYDQSDASTYPEDMAATWQRGRAVVAHSWTTSPSTYDYSLAVSYLGGYSTVTMPKAGNYDQPKRRGLFTRTFFPYELPENVGWTAAGAGTSSLSNSTLTITGTAARYYDITPASSGSIAEGLILMADLDCTAVGSGAGDVASIRARLDDGSNGYEVSIRVSTATTKFFDENASPTQIGSDISIDATAGVQFLLAVETNKARLWYRSASTDSDRKWIAGPTTTSLTDDSGAVGNHRIRFGNKIVGSSTSDTVTSHWTMLQIVTDAAVGDGLADGQTNPGGVFGRTFSGVPVYVDGGVQLRATDGPTFIGDDWNVDTRYEYPIEDVLPAVAPSPITGWRSVGTAEQTIAFQLDAAAETIALNDVIALHLEGINWRLGKLQGYDIGTTSWVDIVTLDAATGQSGLTFARNGNITKPGSGTNAGSWYYMPGELNGATAELVSGSTVRRKISSNNEGAWRDSTTKQLKFKIDDTAVSDPGSGTLNIWSRRLTAIVQMRGVTYQGYRIKIDAQSTADGYFEIGSAVLGPVFIFGRDYSWGRVRSIEPNVEVTTATDGSRRSRKLGNARRAVDFGWTEGVDLTNISKTTPDPDYAMGTTSGGGEPIAASQDGPLLMYGLADMLDGPHTPVVYLPRIRKGTPNVYQYVTRGYALYGRLAGGVRLETVQGSEQRDEVTRVATVTIEEEV